MRHLCLPAYLVLFALFAEASSAQSKPVDIGDRRELFVDKLLIESLDGARMQLHRPQPAEIAIKFDKPWEGAFCGYVTVIKDGDRFLAYYRGLPQAGRDGTDTEVTCVATSRDGIQWTKPKVGIFQYNDSFENNIVLSGQKPASHNFAPFLDANPKCRADQRFKALGGNDNGLIAFVSPDGVKWKRLQQDPVFKKGVFDSQNVSFWSQTEQQYICYFRTWTGKGYRGYRTISRTTSDDFVNWSDPKPMQFGNELSEHLYTNQTTPYFRAPHIYLGLAARFMPGRKVVSADDAKRIGVSSRYASDCSDTVLLSTRGGDVYHRTFRESFMRPGLGAENWVSRSNYAARGIVPTGKNEISIYVCRNYGQPTSYLQRYKLRTDGFASVSAGFLGGSMTTRLIAFDKLRKTKSQSDRTGRQLSLNMSTSAAGSIRVEIQDESGKAIDGFALTDCDEIVGDQIERVVSWKGKSDVSGLIGKPIRLKFVLKDADLYSLQIE